MLYDAAGRVVGRAAQRIFKRIRPEQPNNRKRPNAPAAKRGAVRGSGQWDRLAFSGGRRLPSRAKNQRVLAAGINRIVYAFKGLSGDSANGGWSGDAGFYYLSFLRSTDSLTTQYPVYIQNLTAVVNDGTTPQPFMRLQGTVSNVTSSIKYEWGTRNGQNSTGGASGNLLTLESPGTSVTTTQVGAKGYLDWVSIKANIYGATARPTEVRLSLVTFADDDMLPENNLPGSTAHNKHNLFWSAVTKRLIGNPIADSNAPAARAMKVIWSTTVRLQPGQTTDQDQDPDTRTLSIFRRLNKTLNYRGDIGGSASLGQLVDPGQSVTHTNSDSFGNYPAKARDNVYLLITAVNHSPQQNATSDAATTTAGNASFDLYTRIGFKTLDAF